MLVEFDSAVNALNCAVEFQNKIKKRNDSGNTDVKLQFRLGINMGDVIKKEGNLLGEGVNLVERLEHLHSRAESQFQKAFMTLLLQKRRRFLMISAYKK